MTRPSEVLVQVDDLWAIDRWTRGGTYPGQAIANLLAAKDPEPEWEPTDEMRAKYRQAMDWANEDSMNRTVDLNLRALHREGLIP